MNPGTLLMMGTAPLIRSASSSAVPGFAFTWRIAAYMTSSPSAGERGRLPDRIYSPSAAIATERRSICLPLAPRSLSKHCAIALLRSENVEGVEPAAPPADGARRRIASYCCRAFRTHRRHQQQPLGCRRAVADGRDRNAARLKMVIQLAERDRRQFGDRLPMDGFLKRWVDDDSRSWRARCRRRPVHPITLTRKRNALRRG